MQSRKENELVVIGFCGLKKCYLNVNKRKALERYIKSEGEIENMKTVNDYIKGGYMKIYKFTDELEAYDIYGN